MEKYICWFLTLWNQVPCGPHMDQKPGISGNSPRYMACKLVGLAHSSTCAPLCNDIIQKYFKWFFLFHSLYLPFVMLSQNCNWLFLLSRLHIISPGSLQKQYQYIKLFYLCHFYHSFNHPVFYNTPCAARHSEQEQEIVSSLDPGFSRHGSSMAISFNSGNNEWAPSKMSLILL